MFYNHNMSPINYNIPVDKNPLGSFCTEIKGLHHLLLADLELVKLEIPFRSSALLTSIDAGLCPHWLLWEELDPLELE